MPDFKYGSDASAQAYSGVAEYVRWCQQSLLEMQRQAGDLALDSRGVAVRGLLVRHLVLPGGLAGSRTVIDFLAERISPHTYLNIMDQYRPCFRAGEHRQLARRVFRHEVEEVVSYAREKGMDRLLY
jgi:putative pyruvate formate lyase activating enzyme